MEPKIYLRHDQTLSQTYQDGNVVIVAPEWVRKGLKELSKHIPAGTKIAVYEGRNRKVSSITIGDELTLKDLVMLARNEPSNISGKIDYELYEPLIPYSKRNIIHAIKDLVRQCVIVAKDETTLYGGYPDDRIPPKVQIETVYIADLVGLQFQKEYNTGRLVLIGNNLPDGLLDDLIFKEVVGEDKKSYKEASEDESGRYMKHRNVYFDTIAYTRFVANDVVVAGLALNLIADQGLNFKFLKYGTGYFAGNFSPILEKYLYVGVTDGLDKLFSLKDQQWIKHVELPFYSYNQCIDSVCKNHGITCRFSMDDALKRSKICYVTATTNCADAHAITGNEMGYASVDAAIAQNLKSKGNKFSPILNTMIREKFI